MELKDRIRGYLPVVIDVETSGFNDKTDALLEICAIILSMDERVLFFQKQPFIITSNLLKGQILSHQQSSLMVSILIIPLDLPSVKKRGLTEIFDKLISSKCRGVFEIYFGWP